LKKVIAAALLAFVPVEAQADDCLDRISMMFDGGALDPFARTPHHLTNTMSDVEGNVIRKYQTRWQTPARSVSGVEGSGLFVLIIDSESWMGPSLDGPWTKSPNNLPANHMDVRRKQHAQERANLTETACPGVQELDGTQYDAVSYVTRTDPNPQMQDMWFGARHTVYIDPKSNKVMRWDSTDFVSSFAPELSKDVQIQLFTYDDTLVIERPD